METRRGDIIPEITIQPASSWRLIDLRELGRFRELIFFLSWRDLKVRYKQTLLGVAWAVIQPVITEFFFRSR